MPAKIAARVPLSHREPSTRAAAADQDTQAARSPRACHAVTAASGAARTSTDAAVLRGANRVQRCSSATRSPGASGWLATYQASPTKLSAPAPAAPATIIRTSRRTNPASPRQREHVTSRTASPAHVCTVARKESAGAAPGTPFLTWYPPHTKKSTSRNPDGHSRSPVRQTA